MRLRGRRGIEHGHVAERRQSAADEPIGGAQGPPNDRRGEPPPEAGMKDCRHADRLRPEAGMTLEGIER